MCPAFRQLIQNLPELRAVVHLTGVGKLVQQHVIHQVRREQHQVAGEVDASRGRTASPSALASGYLHFLVLEAIVFCQLAQEGRQVSLGGFLQGTDDGIAKQFLYGFLCEIDLGRAEDGNPFFGGTYHKSRQFA